MPNTLSPWSCRCGRSGDATSTLMSILHPAVAIIEDDDAMRKSIERILHAQAYDAQPFASAEAFLDSNAANQVHALVLDIHLPKMSGIELKRHLLASGSTLPVIFMTAYDGAETRAQAVTVGCVAYLRKPFDASELLEALKLATSQ